MAKEHQATRLPLKDRGRLERVVEQLLLDNMGKCVFWDGDDWLADDMETDRLARQIVDEFERQVRP